MSKIVIIGAGAMGSAFAVPCADNSNEVYLVGSFLEDKVIEEINIKNNFHPILKSQLPPSIKVIKFSEFNVGSTTSDIDYLVGYKNTDNVQIPVGLVGTNTTYTVSTAQAGANETITLTGSDSSKDTISSP